MFIGKLALLLLAVFAVALVVRFVLRFRNFQRRYDETAGAAVERFRQRLEQQPAGREKSRTR